MVCRIDSTRDGRQSDPVRLSREGRARTRQISQSFPLGVEGFPPSFKISNQISEFREAAAGARIARTQAAKTEIALDQSVEGNPLNPRKRTRQGRPANREAGASQ